MPPASERQAGPPPPLDSREQFHAAGVGILPAPAASTLSGWFSGNVSCWRR